MAGIALPAAGIARKRSSPDDLNFSSVTSSTRPVVAFRYHSNYFLRHRKDLERQKKRELVVETTSSCPGHWHVGFLEPGGRYRRRFRSLSLSFAVPKTSVGRCWLPLLMLQYLDIECFMYDESGDRFLFI